MEENENNKFPSLLPIATRVASQTIGLDLVSVEPMKRGLSKEESERIQEIRHNVAIDNRNAKIDFILDDTEYKLIDYKDTDEYHEVMENVNGLPSSELFYLDFKYEDK